MQLNALSNYLQHQPLGNNATSEAQGIEGISATEEKPLEPGAYSPSQRAILISAVATEFDVEQLSQEQVGQLQLKLQQFGLLQGNDIGGFAILHNARGQLAEGEVSMLWRCWTSVASALKTRSGRLQPASANQSNADSG